MHLVCNSQFDCPDKSDEMGCQNVVINQETYKKDILPYNPPQKLNIEVSIFLLNVNDIELPSTFDVKFNLILKWKDYRLEYHYLHKNNLIDAKTRQKIWIPPLIFSNTADNKILYNDEKTMMLIKREGNFTLNSDKELHEYNIFRGNENTIEYLREYHFIFQCNYDLANFPFDEQICTIDVEIHKIYENFIDLVASQTGNVGISKLDQFIITEVEIESLKNNNMVRCSIHFKRIPLYHIATTYMPTICILFMALVTLFIDQSHFEATIMVALTAMLVMYTLFQSISASMPSTAYLKLLDIWLIFGLVMPFIVFTVEVLWELSDGDYKKGARNNVYPIKSNKKRRSKLMHCKWILPTVTLIFVVLYGMVVAAVY